MKKLLIIGASSGIGLWTTQKALKQGYAVRAFSRHAEKMRIRHDRLDKVNGNALDAGNVAT
ncbi:MAG: NAD(P)H-binding protein, partial [Marinicaulis sp.]|nr:NAD(P)H-binding protein [Marinicaulis sp.]